MANYKKSSSNPRHVFLVLRKAAQPYLILNKINDVIIKDFEH